MSHRRLLETGTAIALVAMLLALGFTGAVAAGQDGGPTDPRGCRISTTGDRPDVCVPVWNPCEDVKGCSQTPDAPGRWNVCEIDGCAGGEGCERDCVPDCEDVVNDPDCVPECDDVDCSPCDGDVTNCIPEISECKAVNCDATVNPPDLTGVSCEGDKWQHQHDGALGPANNAVDDAWTTEAVDRGVTEAKEARSLDGGAIAAATLVVSVVMLSVAVWAEANNEDHTHWEYECWADSIRVGGHCEGGLYRECALEADLDGDGRPEKDRTCSYGGVLQTQCTAEIDARYEDKEVVIEEERGTGDYPKKVKPCMTSSAQITNRAKDPLRDEVSDGVSDSWARETCGPKVPTNID